MVCVARAKASAEVALARKLLPKLLPCYILIKAMPDRSHA